MAFVHDASSLCNCVLYQMLGRFHGDYHWHAALGKPGQLKVRDEVQGKSHVIKLPVTYSSLLQLDDLKRTDIGLANVISQCSNLLVVQVFCRDATRIFLCDLLKREYVSVYDRPYGSKGRPCLYECQISPDRSRLLIKVCRTYATVYCKENASQPVQLVEVCPRTGVSSKLMEFSDSILHYTSAVFCPAHHHSEILMGMICDMSEIAAPQTRSRAYMYVPLQAHQQSYTITRYRIKDGQIHKITSTAVSLIPSRDMEMKVTCDGRYLLLSSLGMDLLVPPKRRSYERAVFVFQADTLQRLAVFNHICSFGVCNLTRMMRQYGTLTDCLGSSLVLDCLFNPSTLKELCRKQILNFTSPAGILNLPLPKSVLDYLKFCPLLE